MAEHSDFSVPINESLEPHEFHFGEKFGKVLLVTLLKRSAMLMANHMLSDSLSNQSKHCSALSFQNF